MLQSLIFRLFLWVNVLSGKIAFVTHPDYTKHFPTYDHPECPDRVTAIAKLVENSALAEHVDILHPEPAPIDQVTLVHSPAYLEKLKTACENGKFWFDYEDTYINAFSYEIALLSAGGCIEGARAVLEGPYERVFCSVRPPGHHAAGDLGMGFCLLNNIAITARVAQRQWGLGKIMILDWDVHHGNGTQEIFEKDPSVFYVSIHEHPTFIFPGTGRRWERGSGPGSGYSMNIPLPPGAGDGEYIHSMESHVIPAIKEFAPELILISAGFDAHNQDPISDMTVTEEGFRKLTALTLEASRDYSSGKVVSILEGGYHLEALKASVRMHLEELIFFGKEGKCLSGEE